jgi:hypothetical protein
MNHAGYATKTVNDSKKEMSQTHEAQLKGPVWSPNLVNDRSKPTKSDTGTMPIAAASMKNPAAREAVEASLTSRSDGGGGTLQTLEASGKGRVNALG